MTVVEAPKLEPAARESPYVGLTYYSEKHADLFFGRETERKRLIGNLRASRFTLLYAESGVGKSSLLRAGVVARLRELGQRSIAERGSARYVPVIFSSWRDDPIGPLIDSIEATARSLLRVGAHLEVPRDSLEAAIKAAAEAVDATLLIILDQFEEFFLYADADVNSALAEELARCVNRDDLRANFLISIREDAYARLGDLFKGRIPNVYGNYLHLEHLDVDAAREAIVKPVERFTELRGDEDGAQIEDDLVDKVLEQVGRGKVEIGDAGRGEVASTAGKADGRFVETPYLQLVMQTLWEEEVAQGSRTLRLTTLQRLGGSKKIIQAHLDKAMAGLPEGEQTVAAAAFRYLVTASGRKIALTACELRQFTDLPESELEHLLERLSAGDVRILRPVAGAEEGDSARYEIFHDVLAGAVLDWRSRHVQKAKEREFGARLGQEEQERRAAEAREHEQRRRARTFRAVAVVAGVFAIVAAIALVVGYNASKRSTSQRYAAESLSTLSIDPIESVRLAVKALDARWTPQAENALRLALPELRLRKLFRDTAVVNAAAFSPDGQYLVTASHNSARVWDVTTGRPVERPLRAHGPVISAAFSPDGNHVAAVTGEGRLLVWDWRQGTSDDVPDEFGSNVAFSRDGRYVASAATYSSVARVWEMRRLHAKPHKVGHRRNGPTYHDVSFDPKDSRYVVIASDDRAAYVWDWRRNKRLVKLDGHFGAVYNAVFSPDGNYVLTASGDKQARVFRWRNWHHGDGSQALVGHDDYVTDAQFSPDGSLVVTASLDGSARVWEWSSRRSGNDLGVLRGHAAGLTSAVFSPDGHSILTASADKTAGLWAWQSSAGVDLRPSGATIVNSAHFSGDGRYIVASSYVDHKVWILDARTGQAVDSLDEGYPSVLEFPADGPWDAQLNPQGNLLVTADGDYDARIWRVADGRINDESGPLQTLTHHKESVGRAAFSPDGQRLVTASADGTALIWKLENGRWGAALPVQHRGPVNDAVFSPDGSKLLTASVDNTAVIWNAKTAKRLNTLSGHVGPLNSARFSADGKLVVTAGNDSTARVWDARSGRKLQSLDAPSPLTAATFSPDGKWIYAAGDDGVTRVWTWRSGRVEAVFQRQAGHINSIELGHGGSRVLSASDDGTAKVYECETCLPIGQLLDDARAELKKLGKT